MPSPTVTVRVFSRCVKKPCLILTASFVLPQVTRYTALLFGIAYGLYHRSTLQKAYDLEKAHHATERREKLVLQAKEAWKRRQPSAANQKDAGEFCIRGASSLFPLTGSPAITDPDHPQFDLGKLLETWDGE
jgi:F-type H+-transporting ATP synthase subunit e